MKPTRQYIRSRLLVAVLCLASPVLFAPLAFAQSALEEPQVDEAQKVDEDNDAREQITEFTREEKGDQITIQSTFGSSDIKNWKVLDKYHMVIETYRHGDLLATFSHSCSGLRFADTIGFSTFGPFELDRSTRIILPDGRRCHLKSLVAYEEPKDSEAASPKTGVESEGSAAKQAE